MCGTPYTAPMLPAPRSALLASVVTLVLGVVPGCVTGTTDIDLLEVSVTNIEPLDRTVFEQRLNVELRLRNSNAFDLVVTGMDFELDVNGNRLTRGLSNETVTVPRLGEATLQVPASTSSTAMVERLNQIAERSNAEGLRYDLRGRIYLRGAPVATMSFQKSSALILEGDSPAPSAPPAATVAPAGPRAGSNSPDVPEADVREPWSGEDRNAPTAQ